MGSGKTTYGKLMAKELKLSFVDLDAFIEQKFMKSISKLFEEFPQLKKRYWGRHFWARGYFCATVGDMTEEMIREYLEHHFEPDPASEFKVEP